MPLIPDTTDFPSEEGTYLVTQDFLTRKFIARHANKKVALWLRSFYRIDVSARSVRACTFMDHADFFML
jgi:hypothetical protein